MLTCVRTDDNRCGLAVFVRVFCSNGQKARRADTLDDLPGVISPRVPVYFGRADRCKT